VRAEPQVVQHGGEANASPQVFWVGRNGDQRLGGGPEQQVVDDGLVLERDWRDRGRQGEDEVIVGDRQQIVSLGFQPLSRRRALALRAMTVPARVVGDLNMGAVIAALDVTAKRRSAAGLDRRHHLQLPEADMAGVGLAPRRAMSAKDVGDPRAVTRGPRHRQAGGGRLARFTPSRSKGLVTSRIVLTATRV
jgi:hypothetical protein